MVEMDRNTGASSFALEELGAPVEERLRRWAEEGFAERLWRRDPTLWAERPLPPELADRLGWLALPFRMERGSAELGAIERFVQEVRTDGVHRVVLLGMGGSSLAPEVFQAVFGKREGFPRLTVLDSTHPAAVRSVEGELDPARTLFLVASKSGSTVETLSLLRYFWGWIESRRPGREPGACFAAVTDPGSALAQMARERRFRALFEAPPDVGGRYSALSEFGLVPAALAGVDVAAVVERARRAAEGSLAAAAPDNPGLFLGAALGEAVLAGRDKLTFIAPPALAALPAWIEQLVAESTGKDGTGVVPVVDEPLPPFEGSDGGRHLPFGDDRLFVHMRLEGARETEEAGELLADLEEQEHPLIRFHLANRSELGAHMLLWEVAVAAAGAVLGVQPFDQPDVELAKRRAREALAEGGGDSGSAGGGGGRGHALPIDSEELPGALGAWLGSARPPCYLAIQAFLQPSAGTDAAMSRLRRLLSEATGAATTAGYGPRFLHSTGQLHKGGAETGLFLQLVDRPVEDLPIPETDTDFRSLIRAQALGDARALEERGRPLLTLDLGDDPAAGLARLERALEGAR